MSRPTQQQIDDVVARLMAADVSHALARMAHFQHRIACAIHSDTWPQVIGHLRDLGHGPDLEKLSAGRFPTLSQAQLDTLTTSDAALMALVADCERSLMSIRDQMRKQGATP